MTGFDVPGGSALWPLLDPFESEAAVFWNRQGPITAGRVLARAAALAKRLPERPLAANYCGDRDHFAIALLAIWMRGQTAVFPADRSERSYSLLAGESPEVYCLVDEARFQERTSPAHTVLGLGSKLAQFREPLLARVEE